MALFLYPPSSLVDSNLLGTKKVSKASIHGLDGSLWASSKGFSVKAVSCVVLRGKRLRTWRWRHPNYVPSTSHLLLYPSIHLQKKRIKIFDFTRHKNRAFCLHSPRQFFQLLQDLNYINEQLLPLLDQSFLFFMFLIYREIDSFGRMDGMDG